jgi:cytochrome P450
MNAKPSEIAGGPRGLPAPYFDSVQGVWVLTRFADVSQALHDPQLWLVGPSGEAKLELKDRTEQARNRTNVLGALHTTKVAEWRAEFLPIAVDLADALPSHQVIDVIRDFVRPWSLQLAAKLVEVDLGQARLLSPQAAKVTAATAAPEDDSLKAEAATASAAIDQAVLHSRLPMAGPAFIAISQTVPCLLANAWLILSNHSAEMERLHSTPDLLPKAIEELLRLAGLARVVHRQALADVKIGDALIERGQRVNLMIEAANHDPEQFPQPEQLDLSRRPGHFALGTGDHSCAAAALIRMAMGVATGVFVDKFLPAMADVPVEWRGGSGFQWPASVYAIRREALG